MTKIETKSVLIQLRVRPSFKEATESAAAEDGRSLTSFIERVVSDYLKKKGYLK